jgi:hypothetical protein
MDDVIDAAGEERLQHSIDGAGVVLDHPERKEAFALHPLGLFSDLERTIIRSISPGETG